MEARDLPAGTSRREELSYDRTSGLGPNASQPLGHSSVLPADGSVCTETKVTAPGLPADDFAGWRAGRRPLSILSKSWMAR